MGQYCLLRGGRRRGEGRREGFVALGFSQGSYFIQ